MSRPRFGISGSRIRGNDVLSGAQRQAEREFQEKRYKATREFEHRGQKHIYSTGPDEYNNITKDGDLAGVMELAVLRDGKTDIELNGKVVIGGREVDVSEGKVTFISKDAVNEAVGPILEEKRYKDAILSAMLTDRTGRICRMLLPKDRYFSLKAGSGDYQTYVPNAPDDIKAVDGRPEFWSLYHSSSKEFAMGLHKLSLLVDRSPIAFDQDVMDWLSKFGAAGGAVVSSEPRV
jgi:hypothetical protein